MRKAHNSHWDTITDEKLLKHRSTCLENLRNTSYISHHTCLRFFYVYCNWQQNRVFPCLHMSTASDSRMREFPYLHMCTVTGNRINEFHVCQTRSSTYAKKDPAKRSVIESFRPIILLKRLKILSKVLTKSLALVMNKLFCEAKTCSNPAKCIYDNLNAFRNLIGIRATEDDMGGALINLDRYNVFQWIDHHYFAVDFKGACFASVFFSRFIVLHMGIYWIVRVIWHLQQPFKILLLVHQECPLSSSLHVLTLEPSLRRIEAFRVARREW